MLIHRLFPLLLAVALLAACDGHGDHLTLVSSGNTSIEDGAIEVSGDRVTLHPHHAPEAAIGRDGDFAVNGKAVDVTAAERALLADYYAGARAVREHGIATGKAGSAVAGEAIKGAVSSLAGGDGQANGDRVQAQSRQVEAEAMKICGDLARIRAAQDRLAAQLPEFKPYAPLIGADAVTDCRKDNDD